MKRSVTISGCAAALLLSGAIACLAAAAIAQEAPAAIVGEFADIPGGTFTMGCLPRDTKCHDDERPAHAVTVQPFRLGRHEVTFAQWDACVAAKACSHVPGDEGWGRDSRPVIGVSWNDAQQFMAWAGSRTGLRLRLPTEAEWEYACRAGDARYRYCGGRAADDVAWHGGNSGRRTQPVGEKSANGWGLHDMSGNVWEWTQDCWNETYAGAPADGTAWKAGDCALRVFRGGSWINGPRSVRASRRNATMPDDRINNLGFRLVEQR